MEANRELEPLFYQYLGESGITYPCVKAIVASPYRCRAITAVFRKTQSGQVNTDVCFVVWNWLGMKATLIADGFGTHNGTGGWGLALVLSLIQFYQIPLQKRWVALDQFERIAHGHPSEEDLEQLQHADDDGPDSPYILRALGEQLWSQDLFFTSPVPYWLMEPELLDDLKEIEHDPGIAVFRVARHLEIILRDIGGFPAQLIGKDLINQAVSPGKPFEPHGITPSESEAWAHLFRGVIGAFKNPHSHRNQPLTREEAIAQALTIDLLLRKLKRDYPEKFPQAGYDGTQRGENK
jgi:hypothetical protein